MWVFFGKKELYLEHLFSCDILALLKAWISIGPPSAKRGAIS